MRIAMISMHTSPLQQPGTGDAGGMNVYIRATATELAKQGYEVDIYTRATRPSQGMVVQVAPGLRVINVIAGPYEGLAKDELPTQLAAFAGGIVQFYRCHNLSYDLIHSHYWLSGQVGWLLRDLWRVPLVHTAHTLAAVKNLHSGQESEARRICEQQICDNADLLVVNTQEELDNIVRHYDGEAGKVRIVPPGADVSLFTPGADRATEVSRRELGIPLNDKVIAFVGRLQKFKGPQVLIHALVTMLERDPQRNVRLIICGGLSGTHASPEFYQDMARELGVAGRIRFLPPRPPEELVSVYRAADIVAVPSFNESFGLVAMEAQATGTPVVAARVGGLPIAVAEGETGMLVNGHDPHVWADALATLLDDNDTRIRMGENAVRYAQSFSWAETSLSLASVYSEALSKQPGHCPARRAIGG